MNTREWISNLQSELEKDWDYYGEYSSTLFTEKILEYMAEHRIKKTDLAVRLNTSPAYITKLLNGGGNFTFKKIFQICFALNLDFNWQIRPSAYTIPTFNSDESASLSSLKVNYYKSDEITYENQKETKVYEEA